MVLLGINLGVLPVTYNEKLTEKDRAIIVNIDMEIAQQEQEWKIPNEDTGQHNS